MNTFIRIAPYLLLLIGVGLILGAWYFYVSGKKFLASSVDAKGEVVEMVQESYVDLDSSRPPAYYPKIRFKTNQGEEITFKSNVTTLKMQNYQIGQLVEILYLPENPQKAKIKSLAGAWFVPSILGGIGIVFCLFSLGILLYIHFHPKP